MRVRFTRQAQADLDKIFTYIDERNPVAAGVVKARIVWAIGLLADHPLMAPETDEPDVFELSIVRYPYKVYYVVEGDEVWIVHIRHSARRSWPTEEE